MNDLVKIGIVAGVIYLLSRAEAPTVPATPTGEDAPQAIYELPYVAPPQVQVPVPNTIEGLQIKPGGVSGPSWPTDYESPPIWKVSQAEAQPIANNAAQNNAVQIVAGDSISAGDLRAIAARSDYQSSVANSNTIEGLHIMPGGVPGPSQD
jgi:hypothetical protein